MRLSAKEAATQIGVSERLVYVWCEQRKLRHFRMSRDGKRGRILIDEADLDEFVEGFAVEPAPPSEPASVLKHIKLRR